MGYIALVGGAEFRDNCATMDRALLALTGQAHPKVVILPTAAVRGSPRLAGENGVRHFWQLGADASAAMVVTRADAEDPQHVAHVTAADMIYLAGGDPPYLLETLRDSAVWRAVLTVYQRGGMVVGSSAGAMVLAEKMRPPQTSRWVDALALAPGVAVLPHHDPDAQRERAHQARVGLDLRIAILGIGEASAVVTQPDGKWQALGVRDVAIYTTRGGATYRPGQSFAV